MENSNKAATGNVAGILLYAKKDEIETLDDDMIISGNPISLKTLDLNQDAPVITSQLEKLCSWLKIA